MVLVAEDDLGATFEGGWSFTKRGATRAADRVSP